MSRVFRKQYAEPLGRVVEDSKGEGLLSSGAAAPTSGISGYQPGSLYINTAGSLGSFLYLNTGTLASSAWTNIA